MFDKKCLIMYAVTDRYWLNGRELRDDVEKTLKGGATFIQLREKTLPEEDIKKEAQEIMPLCRQYGVPFVIDDDVELAKAVGADGVHVGQEDMACTLARKELGPDAIVGVSAQTVEQAVKAEKDGADYLGVGAVFPTGSKADAVEVDHNTVKAICDAVSIPVVAIGGITKDNIHELDGLGLDGISVISAIFAQPDIEAATRDLKQRSIDMVNA